MEVRKIKIGPEDESRLRELLRIHEAAVDRLTDEQLDEAEQRTSEQIQNFLQNHGASQPTKSVLRFRRPLKSGAMAFLAAAAAVLFVQMNISEQNPYEPQIVSKGTVQGPALSCESSVVESDGTTPQYDRTHYLVKANKKSYLKLHCGQPVFVHVGYMKGSSFFLEVRNLTVSTTESVVMRGKNRVDVTALARKKSGLMVLVTEKPISKVELSDADRQGFWMDDLPLAIKP
ncbi:MAG: hypothetical protein M3Q07_15885 [Pseudobdellovibrionaceae bacterium]|nr:hypothetical protein [Pseudobdellovibrionaceae bacterium]